jgi:hypothetical protein
MIRRLLAALLAAVLASGCSVQLAYNNLDRLARWSMSDYIDFDASQRAYFDAAIDELWHWHRGEHLPAYAEFLDAIGPRLVDGTSEAEMQALVNRVIGWGEEIQGRAMPSAAVLLSSLSDAQVAALADNLADSNEELAEPEADASLEEAQATWRDEFEDRFSGFSGRLTGVQEAYLDQLATRYRPELVLWAEYRRRWQGDLLALLTFRADVAGLQQGLAELSDNRERYYGPELAEIDAHNEALLREGSVWLINSLTERQGERFVERLGELATDFRELAAQSGPAPAEPPCLMRC